MKGAETGWERYPGTPPATAEGKCPACGKPKWDGFGHKLYNRRKERPAPWCVGRGFNGTYVR